MDISFIPFNFPKVKQVKCLFQTRVGGMSHGAYGGGNISFATADEPQNILHNRLSLQKQIGFNFSELHQVHGDELVFDPPPIKPTEKPIYDADGQATSQAGLALIIKTADCQPILISHNQGKHIMALHVGWRGNRIDFILSAIQRFCEKYELLPKDLLAVRGPSLGPQAAEFINFDSEWGQEYSPWFCKQKMTMDLWSLSRHQLNKAGISAQNIFGLDMCTATMQELFFSYRNVKLSGRQASAICIIP